MAKELSIHQNNQKITLTKTYIRGDHGLLFMTCVIGILSFAISDTIPPELQFKAWALIYMAPIIAMYLVVETRKVIYYPRVVVIDLVESCIFFDGISIGKLEEYCFIEIERRLGLYAISLEKQNGNNLYFKGNYETSLSSEQIELALSKYQNMQFKHEKT